MNTIGQLTHAESKSRSDQKSSVRTAHRREYQADEVRSRHRRHDTAGTIFSQSQERRVRCLRDVALGVPDHARTGERQPLAMVCVADFSCQSVCLARILRQHRFRHRRLRRFPRQAHRPARLRDDCRTMDESVSTRAPQHPAG